VPHHLSSSSITDHKGKKACLFFGIQFLYIFSSAGRPGPPGRGWHAGRVLGNRDFTTALAEQRSSKDKFLFQLVWTLGREGQDQEKEIWTSSRQCKPLPEINITTSFAPS